MSIARHVIAIAALFTMSSAPALAENPVALQREYLATKGQFVLVAPAHMNLADVHARLITLMNDSGSELQEVDAVTITARTTFATFADPMLVPILGGVVDLNYQRAVNDAAGVPIYQVRRITLTQEDGQPVRVQFCSRVKQYTPRSNGAPDVRVATQCKLAFREWNALREATSRLFESPPV
ncbi:MAG TPA: hypothetical protein VIV63_02860 [Steroidobacteraceae bacterium]